MNLITSDTDLNDNPEVLVDPHSKFGIHLQETVASPGADPVDILIQLEDFVLEEFGVVTIRASRATVQIRKPR